MNKREFVQRMLEAIDEVKARGARLNTVAVIAQAANESAWGNSLLTRKANNLFGIKAGKSWNGPTLDMGTREWDGRLGRYVEVIARWRVYDTWADCISDYARIIQSLPWFQDALPHADIPDGDGDAFAWIRALIARRGEPGWATSPSYYEHVSSIIGELEIPKKPEQPQEVGIRVEVNGQPLPADAIHLAEDGRVFIWVRALASALNGEVSWDQESRTAIVKLGVYGNANP